MMREQDSDSTLPSEGRDRGEEVLMLCRMERQEGLGDLQPTVTPKQSVVSPPEVVCSFCGVATHGHRDCPLLHQYIREQADALAEMRLREYRQLQGWDNYEPSKPVSPKEGPLRRGGGPHEGGPVSRQGPPLQKASRAAGQAKPGIIGSLYPHLNRGIAPGGGEEPPPPDKRGLPPDKPDDEEGNEDEGEDTDEETESVTSSSQGSAGRVRHQQWKGTKVSYGSGAGGPPEDPSDPSGRGERWRKSPWTQRP